MGLVLNADTLRELVRKATTARNVIRRETLSDWQLSRVERVYLDDGSTIILKRSKSPLVDEGRVLSGLRDSDIPVPSLHLAHLEGDVLTLVMEDAGPPKRQPTVSDAAEMAVRIHATPPPAGLSVLHREALLAFPVKMRQGIDELASSGRWGRTHHMFILLTGIEDAAPSLVQGATHPPFGLCHSEFHPTSVPIGTKRTVVIDWAQAYVGPGLLDLASWFQYGARPPTSEQCRSMIDAYAAAGGPEEALEPRGSLPPEDWAPFWNRLWVVEWFVRSCTSWMKDLTQDLVWEDAVERHLREALSFVP